MVYWTDYFGRFHCQVPYYVPYELKTLDCPVVGKDSLPALNTDGQSIQMRCVREIARREMNGEVEWLLISWLVGLPGVTFQQCSSLADARKAFDAAPEPIRLLDENQAEATEEPS